MRYTNCPNCGAPFKGGSCEYCGTELIAMPARQSSKSGFTRLDILTANEMRRLRGPSTPPSQVAS